MGKRDTFEKNIKKLTKTRSLKRALEGWIVTTMIRLSKNGPMVACELCGTRFRNGAVVRHAIGHGKPTTITNGGDCLGTLLREAFLDHHGVSGEHGGVKHHLREVYGALVSPGAWITWIVENAPARLAPIVAQLHCLGVVTSDRDLQKLVKFHDTHRLYPREALISESWGLSILSTLPANITIDQARAFRNKMLAAPREFLLSCSRTYEEEVIDDAVGENPAWGKAWAALGTLGQRLAIALCTISDDLDDASETTTVAVTNGLRRLAKPIKLPLIAWNPTYGLGVIEEWTSDEVDRVEVWLWHTEKYVTIDYSDWCFINSESDEFVESVELVAFWGQPAWFKGKVPRVRRVIAEEPKKPKAKVATGQSAPVFNESFLKRFVPMQQLLEIAQFRLNGNESFRRQVTWIADKLRDRGLSLNDLVWMLERYSSNPDAQQRVDGLITSLASVR